MSTHSGRCLAPLLVALALALVGGCSSIKVTQEFAPGTDFSPYRTFAMMPAAEQDERFRRPPLPPAAPRRIEDALTRELIARGLRPAGAAQADLSVAYHVGRRKGMDPSTYGQTYKWTGPSAQAVPIQREIEEGALLVDLVDARTGRLVWRGEAKGKPDPREIDAAAAAVLAQYPHVAP